MKYVLAPMAVLALLVCATAFAQKELPPQLRKVGIDQRLNEQVPLDLTFRDSTGREVHLRELMRGKPVVLVLAYYRCPRLCIEVLNRLADSLQRLSFNLGEHYDVITVSFDPEETPERAAKYKENYVERYGRSGAADGWHFLTGEQAAIDRLTEAIGFRYSYDTETDQFAHAAGIMLLTPDGKLSRYFYGLDYPPRDLRLGLVEASRNEIGSPVDQIRLFCFHYDPATGKYTPAVMNFVRLGGAITLVALGTFLGVGWYRSARGFYDKQPTES
jgi:protein SCO1/2